MDKLEKFILENRVKFDEYQPSSEIWKRLQFISPVSLKGKKRFLILVSRVAAIILIFALSFMVHEYRDHRKERKYTGLPGIYKHYPELQEAAVYYNHIVSGKLKDMKPFLERNPMIAGELKGELAELDSVYKSLKTDLLDNIANDQIIDAMILNYKLKLEILEDLQNELRTDFNNYQHESNSLRI